MNKYVVAFSIVASLCVHANLQSAETDFPANHLISILEKYVDDSGMVNYLQIEAVLYFISLHLNEEDSAFLEEGNPGVKYLKYDWSLNARKIQ